MNWKETIFGFVCATTLGATSAMAFSGRDHTPLNPQGSVQGAQPDIVQVRMNEYGGHNIAGSNQRGERHYGSARGWNVVASEIDGQFAYCAAEMTRNGLNVRIGWDGMQWQVAVPIRSHTTWEGQLDIDGRIQFASGTAEGDWTIVWLGLNELDRLKRGNNAVIGAGRYDYDFPLNGTTAAIGKVQECVDRSGRRAASPSPAPRTPAPARATCDTVTEGTYSCEVSQMPPEAGYQEVLKVVGPNSNYNDFFIKMKDNDTADVWISFSGADWQFLGSWAPTHPGSDCIEPLANQTRRVRDTLGQDAWSLCLR